MSYNILLGAGVDRQRDKQLRPQYQNSNRFTDLIVLVKDANPDVLGLQEATDWDRGSPSVIQQVADELKMNYFLAKNPNQMNIAILSKFQIVDAENLSADIGDNGALRATLNTPDGEHLNVFVVHLRTYL
jgi:endonuclease/exonuclease/phosphatase family metal-dependent hydrolase